GEAFAVHASEELERLHGLLKEANEMAGNDPKVDAELSKDLVDRFKDCKTKIAIIEATQTALKHDAVKDASAEVAAGRETKKVKLTERLSQAVQLFGGVDAKSEPGKSIKITLD